ncbi:cytidine deaminase [Marivirga tractuosa]|uniref:CMP/dCMP deaminase zinc-binding protein n=1 Tax=Marivirga tractuosa (strain ATCC 23168 / DSM 4126 / NBRC 15989 / NCIMB 1408 / VKM B-1430 / H-43) TaxID=643867 RepID=E4TMX1_MARTH|nr:cytidine deaminase [Marivirga tractuosa]ADR21402.1 CMP/dCMP deaminase zinc-binding protein [Marivirga tractuosa DSM 4126]BDD14144.1 cytidine deaminase [Marivirga tractuosa]
MSKNLIQIEYKKYESVDDLSSDYQKLWNSALEARKFSHSPYSNFTVGAAIELEDGQIITGTNQENASFPAGLCAERTAMYRAGIQAPDKKFKRIAIAASRRDSDQLASAPPCGGCRQVMLEFEKRHQQGFELLFTDADGKFVIIDKPTDLFPFSFVF